MSLGAKIVLVSMAILLCRGVAIAQSVEYYFGNERTGVDLMWFKNFKKAKEVSTPFLFFSRNRANVDYNSSPTAFGSTNAISYNFKNGLGFVTVASFINTGFIPKAGMQLYKQNGSFMFFGWVVADLQKEGNIDLFGLFRYQPKINKKWNGFAQAELFSVYNPSSKFWNVTQRIRLGAKYHQFAFGLMIDLNQRGIEKFITTEKYGAFLRYEF